MFRIATIIASLFAIGVLISACPPDTEDTPPPLDTSSSSAAAITPPRTESFVIPPEKLNPPFVVPDTCVGSSYKKVMTFIPPNSVFETKAYESVDVVSYMKYVREIRNIKYALAGVELLPRMQDPSAWLTLIQAARDLHQGAVYIPVEDTGTYLGCDKEHVQSQSGSIKPNPDGSPAWAEINWYQEDAQGLLHPTESRNFTPDERVEFYKILAGIGVPDFSEPDFEEDEPNAVDKLDGQAPILWWIENHSSITSMAITPDWSYLVVGHGNGSTDYIDSDGTKLWSIEVFGRVSDVAIAPDGSRVAVGYRGTVESVELLEVEGRLVNQSSNENLFDIEKASLTQGESRQNDSGRAATPDGSRTAVKRRDRSIDYLDEQQNLLWSFDADGIVSDLAIAPDGSRVAFSAGNVVSVLDGKGNLIWSFEVKERVSKILLSSDGSRVVVGSRDGSVYMLNGGDEAKEPLKLFAPNAQPRVSNFRTSLSINTVEPLWSFETQTFVKVAVTSNSSRVVVAELRFGGLTVLDGQGNLIWSIDTDDDEVVDLDVAPDGSRIVLALQIESSPNLSAFLLDSQGNTLRSFEFGAAGISAAITPDKSKLAILTFVNRSVDPNVHLVDSQGRVIWSSLLIGGMTEIAITHDGARVAVAFIPGGFLGPQRSQLALLGIGRVILIDEQGNPIWSFDVDGWALSVAITPDGSRVAIGSNDESIYLLDGQGSLLWSFKAGGEIRSVAISSDGSTVAAGSKDGNVYIFDGQGKQLWAFETGGNVRSVAITPDGSRVVAASTDGNVYFLDGRGQ